MWNDVETDLRNTTGSRFWGLCRMMLVLEDDGSHGFQDLGSELRTVLPST